MASEKLQDDDALSSRWEWQRRVKSNPRSASLYRLGVGIVGLIVVVAGVIMLPFPGPGWLVIFLGLGIWASEFDWAKRLLEWVKVRVQRWWDLLDEKGWWAKALAALVTGVLVTLVFWALFAISGIPDWLPDIMEEWLGHVPGLG